MGKAFLRYLFWTTLHLSHAAMTQLPIVINTWSFVNATKTAFQVLNATGSAVRSIEEGCNICDFEQCDFTVGYGGSPDAKGETTLDAMIMDGTTRNVGAVAFLRRIKSATRVARAVMDYTAHSILAGEGATEFAKMMGFKEESLSTEYSTKMYLDWKHKSCQPNYYRNFLQDQTSCPPYHPEDREQITKSFQTEDPEISEKNHDTIGMVAISSDGQVASGASSNGANHKVPGRIGDAAIPGAGSYADSSVGGAAATGDGDVMMRFSPTLRAVQYMSHGLSPTAACTAALRDIVPFAPTFKGALVCVNTHGEYGGACHGWVFTFSVQTPSMASPKVVTVHPFEDVVEVQV